MCDAGQVGKPRRRAWGGNGIFTDAPGYPGALGKLPEEAEVMKLSGCEIEERDLIRQVIRNLKGPSKYRSKHGQFRWALVRDAFGVGSGVATALCREFGFDPEEMIRS